MRRDLLDLEVYPPPPDLEALARRAGHPVAKLDANENPYGPSPLVAEALRGCIADRYPDPDCTELREGLGAYLGVDPETIVCSAGGDEMIDLLLRLFLEPGDEVIDCPPSFVMYPPSTAFHHGQYVPVPRLDGRILDVEGIERAVTPRTKVIFLCNPNNPTGNRTPTEQIERVLRLGPVVALDEAYAEFAGWTLVELTRRYPNLVVLRTMSKWAALAGLRLGYAVADPCVREEMRRIVSPYHVGAAAQAAGIASLRDREHLMANVHRIVAERERLYDRLSRLPFGAVYPSEGNFLYWTTDGPDAAVLRDALARRAVLVRAVPFPVPALRFSIGTPRESDWLMEALEDAYAELEG